MDLPESNTHSFIVKIWLEDGDPGRWRGHITHVPGGERKYFEDPAEIIDFIANYAAGIKPPSIWRKWLAARRSRGNK